MEALKFVLVAGMVGMIARALWMLAVIGKTVWEHRDPPEGPKQ